MGPTLLRNRPNQEPHLPHDIRPGRSQRIDETRPETNRPHLQRTLGHEEDNISRRARVLRRDRRRREQDLPHRAGCGARAAEEGAEGGVLAEITEGQQEGAFLEDEFR